MSVSSISSLSGVNGYASITAASNPAGVAISEKLEASQRGMDKGTQNVESGKDLIQTADGALAGITDSLQRIRELSVQASNSAIYSSDDISSLQDEIEQLKSSIQETAKNTQFNTKNLLDGSYASLDVATNANGSGMTIQLTNSTLETLGIAEYDVTKDFDISAIDDAISQVSSARASMGAQSNAMDAVTAYNNNASINLTSSKSNIEDLDFAEYLSEKKKNDLLDEYKLNFQKKVQQQHQSENRILFGL